MKRGWDNDPICKLCGIEQETLTYLCKDCPIVHTQRRSGKASSYIWFHLSVLNIVNTKWITTSVLVKMQEKGGTEIKEGSLMG